LPPSVCGNRLPTLGEGKEGGALPGNSFDGKVPAAGAFRRISAKDLYVPALLTVLSLEHELSAEDNGYGLLGLENLPHVHESAYLARRGTS
jgi:hypothetical protein